VLRPAVDSGLDTMSATGTVKLLVKSSGAPSAAGLGLGLGAAGMTVKPLMPSVDAAALGAAGKLGIGAVAGAQWYQVGLPAWQGSVWDACHAVAKQPGLGAAGGTVQFVEPDLQQQWPFRAPPERTTAFAADAVKAAEQNKDYPRGAIDDWFRDDQHGQFNAALAGLAAVPPVVRVAHLDTGYDPKHNALPQNLRTDLAKSFVEDTPTNSAADTSSGILNNLGHGTGTMSILAGRDPADRTKTIGAAPFVEVVPIRVANRVVLFSNSAIAQALNYVHSLCDNEKTRIHVVTMSMGGVASQAWADAINALYEKGVFVVTAAGNNFANAPTHYVVYPARFKRVVAACGAMANFQPYADLALTLMAGNYGPASLMTEAIAAYTPNTPWARFGASGIVDHDGGGTSAATPQVAAAAALWIAKNQAAWKAYPQDWMRVEAIRKALFSSAGATPKNPDHFGNGLLKAKDALSVVPAAASLKKVDPDDVSLGWFKAITGLGVAAGGGATASQRMLELEAAQLLQSGGYEMKVPDGPLAPADRDKLKSALANDPRASRALRAALGSGAAPAQVRKGQSAAAALLTKPADAQSRPADFSATFQKLQTAGAVAPDTAKPPRRKLRVFAYDPALGAQMDTVGINQAVLDIKWEDLGPGPIGEYLEVVDVDPSSNACYAPVMLDAPYLLAQQGLAPSEGDPRFHQQMAYAVASRTIEFFERALGRVALWAPRRTRSPAGLDEQFVQRLRIYPHALRAANAYYSPEKKALLLGYFRAGAEDPLDNAPGSLVFASLSHDIIAHETTHALLDGLHRRYTEATNPDVLAFHEGFADIVALFQHFTMPEALKTQIARTRGDLAKQNLLGELAAQFGRAMGSYGALRDAIGSYEADANGKPVWTPRVPSPTDYATARAPDAYEPHALGALLVAAVFDAFLQVYKARTRDLIRLATGGTGVLPEGDIPADLTQRLAEEAAQIAAHCLEICVRALDYCPPVDITFGEYLRAIITADRDLAPEDPLCYRVAFASSFRARGITPPGVTSLTPDSLAWDPPPEGLSGLAAMLDTLSLHWDLRSQREDAWRMSHVNAVKVHAWLVDVLTDAERAMLGLTKHAGAQKMGDKDGQLGGIEVHSVRPARRIGPNRTSRADLIIEATQTWRDDNDASNIFRGGCTLIVNLDDTSASYLVRKRVDHSGRFGDQAAFRMTAALNTMRANFFDDEETHVETFAALHQAR
jgi:hypothetical protein